MRMKEIIARLIERKDLSRQEARSAMSAIMSGEATPAQIAGFLVGLRIKGETVDEITGCAEEMCARAVKVKAPAGAIDTCGTGGDGLRTFNISTAAAIVAAGAGVPVAKHGNRGVSSPCGSADVLEKLGVKIDAPVDAVERCLAEAGFGFMFAPLMHQAMKHAVGPRRELGVRTVFNVLGPLTNPAGAKRQLMGVFSGGFVRPLAEVLRNLGSSRALLVHGEDRLDEVSPCGRTFFALLQEDGSISEGALTPEDAGLERVRDGLSVNSAEESAAMIRMVLEGKNISARTAVALNAGAALWAAGKAKDLREGSKMASVALDSGAALKVLEKVIHLTNG
ncbi:MAG TPA: anthranilate phosphoribosyltransferase [Planctomycetes bacterium]|nr:anthranilate phosphoribosyltransferase [Planctomycetota bacterium]